MKPEKIAALLFVGSVVSTCRHCGKPAFYNDARELLAHSSPSCEKFAALASMSKSYTEARAGNVITPEQVLN